jgi:hypothetical protein
MKTESHTFWIISSGKVSSTLKLPANKGRFRETSLKNLFRHSVSPPDHEFYHLWVAFAEELDDTFVQQFRKWSTTKTRLLVFNDCLSTDTLLSRFLDLQIRSTERFYVAEFGAGKTYAAGLLLKRLADSLETDDTTDCILDARIEDGRLHVVSPDFRRLNVPIQQIEALKNEDSAIIQKFEIDEDGSFLYWPSLDLHLGWTQLQQIADPEAARKALQRSQEFNERYGQAVRKVREEAGLKLGEISGISEKQLRRVESGECRLTSNAIGALSQSHKLAANEYMKKLAEKLN